MERIHGESMPDQSIGRHWNVTKRKWKLHQINPFEWILECNEQKVRGMADQFVCRYWNVINRKVTSDQP